MKICPGISELWGGGRKSPSPIDKAHGSYNSLYYVPYKPLFTVYCYRVSTVRVGVGWQDDASVECVETVSKDDHENARLE